MALGAGPGGSRASISNLVLKSTRPEAASGRHPPGPRDRPHSSASVQTRGRGPRLRAAPTPLADPSFGGDRLCGPLPPTTVQALQPGYPVACRGGLAACSKPQIAPLLGQPPLLLGAERRGQCGLWPSRRGSQWGGAERALGCSGHRVPWLLGTSGRGCASLISGPPAFMSKHGAVRVASPSGEATWVGGDLAGEVVS